MTEVKKPLVGLCSTCGQLRRACNDEHAQITVAVNDPLFARYFPGIKKNSVIYKGSCTVPASAARDILAEAANWEASELRQRLGRTVDFNLGRIG